MADMTITFGPISEEDFATLADCFCTVSPIPKQQVKVGGVKQVDDDGKPIMEDTCTEPEHLKAFAVKCFERAMVKGYKMKVLAGNPMDEELINRVLSNL